MIYIGINIYIYIIYHIIYIYIYILYIYYIYNILYIYINFVCFVLEMLQYMVSSIVILKDNNNKDILYKSPTYLFEENE